MKAVCYMTDREKRLEKSTVEFTEKANVEMQLIKVYPQNQKQEILGFGGAFTEAAAFTVSMMGKELQEEVAELYFGESGNRYNFCRTHIQSCDFALGNYAYVEEEADRELATFSIERDREYLIPFIKSALSKNKDIQFLASPWSPPAFMKTNGMMNRGGRLKKEYYQMWAQMLARYVKEYEKEGIKISRITVQNEPQAVQTWDSCIYTAEEEGEFAAAYLRQALDKAGCKEVKIAVWDHNKDCILERVEGTFSVEGAKQSVDGIAFHWYSGDHFEELAEVKEKYPDKELIFTEGCVEYSRFTADNQVQNARMYAHDMIGNLNSGAGGIIDWNLVLDQKGGPNHVGNYCDAPVMYREDSKELDIKLSYYYIGHFSRFVKPGARRILVSRYTDKLDTVGFVNPDGERVLVILNKTNEKSSFSVTEGKGTCSLELPPDSIVTLCWS